MSADHIEHDERQRLQRQYAEIATLAGGLAHEIKNPLSTMSMLLELLAEDLDGAEAQRERRMLTKIQTIQKECRHLEDILNAFLKFARVGELTLTPTDLNFVVTEFIDFFSAEAKEHRVEISPHLDSDLPRVSLDVSLMRQVLLNLALNAQQAMPNGGLLELQTFARRPADRPQDRRCSSWLDHLRERTRARHPFHDFTAARNVTASLRDADAIRVAERLGYSERSVSDAT
ncbi:MAG: histidine kinase [Planctomycetota bacterium]|nr:MAG: histidine kinase [Planctomycetota bacterium]